MTAEPWPCDDCSDDGVSTRGVRNVGARGYCIDHLGALYARLDPANLAPDQAFGYQTGESRPDWGLMYADLTCCRCAATWTGVPGEQCWWCHEGHEILVDHHTQRLLEAPDRRPEETYEQRMGAWADRLVIGVNAGLITQTQADTAWKRAVKRTAA